MIALMLLAASVSGTPTLGEPVGNIANWFNGSDDRSSRTGGAVRFKVLFSTDGMPDKCEIEASTGNREVENIACTLIKRRFRYKPSADSDGSPVYRVLVRSVAFASSIPSSIKPPYAFSFEVRGYEAISKVTLVVDVDKDGSLQGCAASPDSLDAKLSAVGKAVCGSLYSVWTPMAELNSAGEPVRYVREIAVEVTHTP